MGDDEGKNTSQNCSTGALLSGDKKTEQTHHGHPAHSLISIHNFYTFLRETVLSRETSVFACGRHLGQGSR